MIYIGEVRNGVIVFGEEVPLMEGTRVRIEPLDPGVAQSPSSEDVFAETRAWMLSLVEEAEAIAPKLPSDLATRHDHYAHGKPVP
jgi:hypothetical protein